MQLPLAKNLIQLIGLILLILDSGSIGKSNFRP